MVKRTPLTRSQILDAAVRIIDEDGADGLTMRRLARELGVEAMSLYHHFPNKAAILEGVVVTVLSESAPAPAPDDDWRDPVRSTVLAFRRALVDHPNILPLLAAGPPSTPETVMFVEGPLRYLQAHGLDERDTADLFQAVFALAFGHALLTNNYSAIRPQGLPPVEFSEASFTRTLDAILERYGGDGRPRREIP